MQLIVFLVYTRIFVDTYKHIRVHLEPIDKVFCLISGLNYFFYILAYLVSRLPQKPLDLLKFDLSCIRFYVRVVCLFVSSCLNDSTTGCRRTYGRQVVDELPTHTDAHRCHRHLKSRSLSQRVDVRQSIQGTYIVLANGKLAPIVEGLLNDVNDIIHTSRLKSRYESDHYIFFC